MAYKVLKREYQSEDSLDRGLDGVEEEEKACRREAAVLQAYS